MYALNHFSNVAITGTARTTGILLALKAGHNIGLIAQRNISNLANLLAQWTPIITGYTRVNGWVQTLPSAQAALNSNLTRVFKEALAPSYYPGALNLAQSAVVCIVLSKLCLTLADWMNNKPETKQHYYRILESITGIQMSDSSSSLRTRFSQAMTSIVALAKEFIPPARTA